MNNHSAMHPGVKLRHIRAFLDIAAEGGLSAVARAQGITQPALSRTLAELESLLGQPMFLRQGRRLLLTEAGAVFRRHAIAAIQSLEAGAAALRPGGSGTLRIGVLPSVATRFLPQVMLRFRELHPQILLAAETGPHFHLMRLLRDGHVDVMVGRLPGASEMAGLSFDHLYEDEVILVARADHPLREHPAPQALAVCPVILPPATALIRPAVNDYLAANGLAGMRPAFETVSLALGRGICLGSDALWFISRGVILHELERAEMTQLPTGARFLSGAVGMTRRQAVTAPGLSEFEDIAREVARNLGGAK
ncbi:LysR substrate-binding domain-containing protein [Paracoccus sp. PAR01]|uniref:LysR substrate-binding domain-containing protein n=1 Tax=Paracoccus sp. PAR01 TaxID=2769282 RepID=UPI00177D9BE1|nr:LysR substrate-binding domain-containing protein [Paracoccus sp. PAR01]MBD9528842.1 LysR family transcriptional regulator [Paracoccus sp. PAR01]